MGTVHLLVALPYMMFSLHFFFKSLSCHCVWQVRW